ncbi:MAG: AzlD domain-containing protein [Actinomycetota bacterium]
MITWVTMLVLAAGVFGQRLAGMVAVQPDALPDRWRAALDAIPLAIIAAVIALQTLSTAGSLTVDARAIGVAAAGVCLWLRLPLAIVVVVAAATTALVRLAA